MEPNQQQQALEEFAAMVEMFQSKGWKLLVQNMEKEIEVLKEIRTIENEAQLFRRQASLSVLLRFVGLEEGIEAARKQIEALQELADEHPYEDSDES